MPVAKEQIRQIIADNNLNSVADVYTLLRDGFKDILQELMEAELDAALGYEKNQKGDMDTANKRNGHSPKKLKSQYGEFQIDVPRDRNGEFEPKIVPKYQRDVSGIEEKVISLYGRGMSTRDIHDQLQDHVLCLGSYSPGCARSAGTHSPRRCRLRRRRPPRRAGTVPVPSDSLRPRR